MEGHETREATKALVQSLWAVLRTLEFIPAVMGSQRGGEGMCADYASELTLWLLFGHQDWVRKLLQ